MIKILLRYLEGARVEGLSPEIRRVLLVQVPIPVEEVEPLHADVPRIISAGRPAAAVTAIAAAARAVNAAVNAAAAASQARAGVAPRRHRRRREGGVQAEDLARQRARVEVVGLGRRAALGEELRIRLAEAEAEVEAEVEAEQE